MLFDQMYGFFLSKLIGFENIEAWLVLHFSAQAFSDAEMFLWTISDQAQE